MYCIFFIHSSVEGHLGNFHILAITNNVIMNIVLGNCQGIHKNDPAKNLNNNGEGTLTTLPL